MGEGTLYLSQTKLSKERRICGGISSWGILKDQIVSQASADARTWDLKKLDLSESAWRQQTTTTLENFQDDALRLKHQLTGQRRSIRRVMEFVKSVADIPAEYQVLTNDFTLGICIAPPKCEGNADGEGCQSCVKRNDYGLLEDFDHITRSMEDYHEACNNMVGTSPISWPCAIVTCPALCHD
jgi:hypothetical protein